MDKTIRQIAKKARRALEKYVQSDDAMGHPYYMDDSLHTLCAISSFFLQKLLKNEDIVVNVRVGRRFNDMYDSHCFCEKDGIVYDITATQFGFKNKVLVEDITQYKKRLDFDRTRITRKSEFRLWPDYQQPVSEKIQHILENYYE